MIYAVPLTISTQHMEIVWHLKNDKKINGVTCATDFCKRDL